MLDNERCDHNLCLVGNWTRGCIHFGCLGPPPRAAVASCLMMQQQWRWWVQQPPAVYNRSHAGPLTPPGSQGIPGKGVGRDVCNVV
jgi:hypothetical protein